VKFEVLMALDMIMELWDVMLCSFVNISIMEESVGLIFYPVDGDSRSLRIFGTIIEAKLYHISED
jgi:hypothetical protein